MQRILMVLLAVTPQLAAAITLDTATTEKACAYAQERGSGFVLYSYSDDELRISHDQKTGRCLLAADQELSLQCSGQEERERAANRLWTFSAPQVHLTGAISARELAIVGGESCSLDGVTWEGGDLSLQCSKLKVKGSTLAANGTIRLGAGLAARSAEKGSGLLFTIQGTTLNAKRMLISGPVAVTAKSSSLKVSDDLRVRAHLFRWQGDVSLGSGDIEAISGAIWSGSTLTVSGPLALDAPEVGLVGRRVQVGGALLARAGMMALSSATRVEAKSAWLEADDLPAMGEIAATGDIQVVSRKVRSLPALRLRAGGWLTVDIGLPAEKALALLQGGVPKNWQGALRLVTPDSVVIRQSVRDRRGQGIGLRAKSLRLVPGVFFGSGTGPVALAAAGKLKLDRAEVRGRDVTLSGKKISGLAPVVHAEGDLVVVAGQELVVNPRCWTVTRRTRPFDSAPWYARALSRPVQALVGSSFQYHTPHLEPPRFRAKGKVRFELGDRAFFRAAILRGGAGTEVRHRGSDLQFLTTVMKKGSSSQTEVFTLPVQRTESWEDVPFQAQVEDLDHITVDSDGTVVGEGYMRAPLVEIAARNLDLRTATLRSYRKESGLSIGGAGVLQTLETLVRDESWDDPLLKSLRGMAAAEHPDDAAVSASGVMAQLWELSVLLEKGSVPGVLGHRLGLTDLEGNVDPQLGARLGFYRRTYESTHAASGGIHAETLRVRVQEEARIRTRLAVTQRSFWEGRKFVFEPFVATSREAESAAGLAATGGSAGVATATVDGSRRDKTGSETKFFAMTLGEEATFTAESVDVHNPLTMGKAKGAVGRLRVVGSYDSSKASGASGSLSFDISSGVPIPSGFQAGSQKAQSRVQRQPTVFFVHGDWDDQAGDLKVDRLELLEGGQLRSQGKVRLHPERIVTSDGLNSVVVDDRSGGISHAAHGLALSFGYYRRRLRQRIHPLIRGEAGTEVQAEIVEGPGWVEDPAAVLSVVEDVRRLGHGGFFLRYDPAPHGGGDGDRDGDGGGGGDGDGDGDGDEDDVQPLPVTCAMEETSAEVPGGVELETVAAGSGRAVALARVDKQVMAGAKRLSGRVLSRGEAEAIGPMASDRDFWTALFAAALAAELAADPGLHVSDEGAVVLNALPPETVGQFYRTAAAIRAPGQVGGAGGAVSEALAPRAYAFHHEAGSPRGQRLSEGLEARNRLAKHLADFGDVLGQSELRREALAYLDAALSLADTAAAQIDADCALEIGLALADLGLSFTPAGIPRDAFEAVSGRHALTGRPLSDNERGMALFSAATLGTAGILAKSVKAVAGAIRRLGAGARKLRPQAVVKAEGLATGLTRAMEKVPGSAEAIRRYPTQLRIYLDLPTKNLQKASKSHHKQVVKHEAKIADPKRNCSNWESFRPEKKDNLLTVKWPDDIRRNRAYKTIADTILELRKT